MKRTTRKLSGPAKERFLVRFFAEEPGLAADIAKRLAARSSATFTSMRIRRAAIKPKRRQDAAQPQPAAMPPLAEPAAAPPPTAVPAAAFDPYSIGLVPVFQREGRDGLMAKLAAVAGADQLRQLAKAQHVVLPQELRTGDAGPDVIRAAIADAVAKRIADRKAAAR